VLNGSVVANGAETTGWFRFDTSDPGACDDAFGTRAPATGVLALGSSLDAVPFSELVTGLVPGRTYYFCAIAQNAQGLAFGEVLTFAPDAVAPEVTTDAATDVAATTATLAGTANPNGTDALGWFRFGEADPGACDDAFGTRVPATDGTALGAGTDPVAFTEALTDLEPNRTYYFCAAASNLGGASFGEVRSFTTPAAPPVVRTTPAIVAPGGATLTGTADPQGSSTTAWFRYDSIEPSACDDAFGTRAPVTGGIDAGDGSSDVALSQAIVGLSPGTYYACAIAENEAGIAYGEVVRFDITEAPSAGGCGCRVGSTGRTSPAAALAVLAALVLVARRRRRRR
jgi:MYXO-CTERM domain-containing protein